MWSKAVIDIRHNFYQLSDKAINWNLVALKDWVLPTVFVAKFWDSGYDNKRSQSASYKDVSTNIWLIPNKRQKVVRLWHWSMIYTSISLKTTCKGDRTMLQNHCPSSSNCGSFRAEVYAVSSDVSAYISTRKFCQIKNYSIAECSRVRLSNFIEINCMKNLAQESVHNFNRPVLNKRA